MNSNLSNRQLNIDYYMHNMLYMNLKVTINQSLQVIQKIKRKEWMPISKESH